MALILDTGPVLALLNAADRNHQACLKLVDEIGEPLVVPAPTLIEIDYWVRKGLDLSIWRAFVEDIVAGAYRLEQATHDDIARAVELQDQYTSLDLGFVDASVIALCERLNEPKVATLDRRDFSVVVPRHVPALELLPAP